MQFTDLTGLAGIALAFAVVLPPLSGRLRARAPAVVFIGLLVLMLLPLPASGLPLAAYVRGAIGDLSITSVLLLGIAAAARCGLLAANPANGADPLRQDAAPVRNRGASVRQGIALLLPLLAGAALYPLALGAMQLDPYQWGFGAPGFLAALLAIAVIGKLFRLPLVAAAIALAVLAWVGGWSESTNLWDYLLDPLLCIYVLGRLLQQTISASKKRPA